MLTLTSDEHATIIRDMKRIEQHVRTAMGGLDRRKQVKGCG